MLEFIKNTILGSRIFNRANSVEVKSKRKDVYDKRRPLSFDSKQKQTNQGLKTSKIQLHPQVIAFDETMTIKKVSPYSKVQKEKNMIYCDEGAVSDIDEDDKELEHLMSYPRTLFVSNVNPQIKMIQKNKKVFDKKGLKSSIIDQNHKKIRIKKQSLKRKIKKIHQKCAVCKQILDFNDSLQLACTHRYHKTCAIQMQWRMRYKCDVCQMKNDHNKGSILLRGISRKRNQ